MFRRLSARLAALFCLVWIAGGLPASALAQTNLVTNGSFEANGATLTIPPTGWTRTANTNCGFFNRTGGSSGFPAATDGTYIAQIAFGQTNISCQYYQDVAIPASSTVTLGFAVGALLQGRTGSLSVSIVPTVGAPLVVYTAPSADVTLAEVTPVDISAYSGQTVRLQINANSGNYYVGYVDNFRISATAAPPPPAPIPTLSEWALILLGLLLAVSAAIHIQRRQLAG